MRALSVMILSAAVMALAPASARTGAPAGATSAATAAEKIQQKQDQGQDEAAPQHPSELALEATRKLMQALELLIQSLPQYGMPRIDERGNIIIPRLPEAPPAPPRPEPKPPPPQRDGGPDTPI